MIGTFLFFAVAVIGFTHILVDSSLFQPVRDWLKTKLHPYVYGILECYQCCGFWCGIIVSLILLSYNPFNVFLGGCAGSFLAVWGANYLNYLEAKSIVEIDE